MNHVLWVDFMDCPHVGDIVRTEELVGRSLSPAIEGKFKVSKEIFPSEDRMTFGPNDRLRKVQAVGLQEGWEIAEIAVTRPTIEGPAWQQDSSDIAEPGMQESIEVLLI
jgi:hypothetical protein